MAVTERSHKPTDPAWPGLDADSLCYLWDEGIEGEIRDASRCTRGEAIAAYAGETGERFTDIRCLVRYVILHTRQDVWDGPGRDAAADGLRGWGDDGPTLEEAYAATPAVVPDDWRPQEGMACWSVCRRDHPRAIRVWMCEVKGADQIPDTPEPPAERRTEQP